MARPQSRKPLSQTIHPVINRVPRFAPRRGASAASEAELSLREKRFNILVLVLLLVFGTYISVLYFGHQVVPNSDFPAFFETGKSILALELPVSFKRVPGLGILQAALSCLVGGRHPDLTAGWLVNAALYPFIGILLYLVGKRLLANNAAWFAFLALINPWAIKLLRHPIVETALVFFILLTFYFIFRRSQWSYFFAALTTMMRYEGAALIMVAFVIDLLESRSWRQRCLALLLSVLAGIPLALWMVGTYKFDQAFQQTGSRKAAGHYLSHYDIKNRNVISKFSGCTWRVAVGSLAGTAQRQPYHEKFNEDVLSFSPAKSSGQLPLIFHKLKKPGQFALVLTLMAAAGYGLYHRQGHVLALLLFLTAYFLAHSLRYGTQDRYAYPIAWLVLLLGCFGLRSCWKLLSGPGRIPRPVVIALQLVLLIGSSIWFVLVVRFLPVIQPYSLRSVSLPYVAMGCTILILLGRSLIYQRAYLLRDLAVTALMFLLISSNQFTLADQVGNGSGDMEFKMLADWCVKNTRPHEKLATTMPHIVGLYAPEYKDNLVKLSRITGTSPMDFIKRCHEENITYVAWDSRIGFNPGNSYYKMWRMENIQLLARPGDNEYFKFITRINPESQTRFINVFKLRPDYKPPQD